MINHIIDKWIEIKNLCPNCKNNTLKINKNIKSISNPVIMRYKKANCRKVVNLKTNAIFGILSKMPISVFIKIIELFIIDNKNGLEIINKLKEIYNL